VTAPGITRTIALLYDLFSDYNPYVTRAQDLRDLIATVGTRGVRTITVADAGGQLDHTSGFVRCDASGGNVAINLPDAASMQGLELVLKKEDASANTITFSAIDGASIDGSPTIQLTTQYQAIRLYSDGSIWEQM
jgi:hypothetical protein